MPECEHKNWRIMGGQLAGEATCLDCGKDDYLYIFINGTAERLQALEKRLEEKVKNK